MSGALVLRMGVILATLKQLFGLKITLNKRQLNGLKRGLKKIYA